MAGRLGARAVTPDTMAGRLGARAVTPDTMAGRLGARAVRLRGLAVSGGVLAVSGGVLAVAGCGSAGVHPSVAVRQEVPVTSVCTAAGDVDSLVVLRLDEFSGNHFRFTFPPRVVARSAARAKVVARAVCALPPMPSGVFSCPADWGLTYRLDFGAPGRRFTPVIVDPTGCEQVSGAGQGRWLEGSGAKPFWPELGLAVGVADASQAFGGCGPLGYRCPKDAPYTR
jgi:hypothetical protein